MKFKKRVQCTSKMRYCSKNHRSLYVLVMELILIQNEKYLWSRSIIFSASFSKCTLVFIPRINWYMPFLSMQLKIWKHYLIHPALIVLYPTFSLLYIVVSFVRIFQEIPTSIIQGYCYDFFNDLSILGRAVGTRGAGWRVRFEIYIFLIQ